MYVTYSLIRKRYTCETDRPAYVTHGSLLEVANWAKRLDLRLGKSKDDADYPRFHCEHSNGTPLSSVEREGLS